MILILYGDYRSHTKRLILPTAFISYIEGCIKRNPELRTNIITLSNSPETIKRNSRRTHRYKYFNIEYISKHLMYKIKNMLYYQIDDTRYNIHKRRTRTGISLLKRLTMMNYCSKSNCYLQYPILRHNGYLASNVYPPLPSSTKITLLFFVLIR